MAIVALRHQLAVVNHVIDARRNHAHSDDAVLAVVALVVGYSERQLQ